MERGQYHCRDCPYELPTETCTQRQCGYHFPGAFGSNSAVATPNAVGLNNLYQGWNTTAQRLIFANGIRESPHLRLLSVISDEVVVIIRLGDPWREATVAADGTTNAGSDMQPHLLSDGFHCSDLLVREGAASAKVKSVQDSAVSYMAKWIAEWKPTA